MTAPPLHSQAPLPEYLRCCDLLTGHWSPGRGELELDLRCRFHSFDKLEPIAADVRLRMLGVEAIEHWHSRRDYGVGDATSRVPPPSISAPPLPWPYPRGCSLYNAVLCHVGWRPAHALTTIQLHRHGVAGAAEAAHRLVTGLLHPDFGDHDVWLAIDHRDCTMEVGGFELCLDRWQAEFHSWIRRAATAKEPDRSELSDIPWP
ncbi:MAG: hypothetical protein RBU30_08750 [Polyangia bacterium]|jgi:hypothetical protein|nr:hypothetical protein [Polyangia bacterium]